MIVAEEMEQPVKGEDPNLGLKGMAGLSRLTPGDAGRDHHIAELTRLLRWK